MLILCRFSKSSIKLIFLSVFITASLPTSAQIFYSSGQMDGGNSELALQVADKVKIRKGDKFPGRFSPGQKNGLYLGKLSKSPIVIRAGFYCKEISNKSKNRAVLEIRYNGQKLLSRQIDETYIPIYFAIPASHHEDEENILNFANLGMDNINVDYVNVSSLNFKTGIKLRLAINHLERIDKKTRSLFPYAWYAANQEKGVKTFLEQCRSSGMEPLVRVTNSKHISLIGGAKGFETIIQEPEISGNMPFFGTIYLGSVDAGKYNFVPVLQKNFKGKELLNRSGVNNACALSALVTPNENLSQEEAFRLVSLMAKAASYNISTILLHNYSHYNCTLFSSIRTGRKFPFGYALPYVAEFYHPGSSSLPCLVNRAGDAPLTKMQHWGASIRPNGIVTIIVTSVFRTPMELTVTLPWHGVGKIRKLNCLFPDESSKTVEEAVSVSSDGLGGILKLKLAPNKFHFIQLIPAGAGSDIAQRQDNMPDPPQFRLQGSKVKVLNDINSKVPPLFIRQAWNPGRRVEGIGLGKEKVSLKTQPATTGEFNNYAELVPENKDSLFLSLPAQQSKNNPQKGGIHIRVSKYAPKNDGLGLGVWLRAVSGKRKNTTLSFIYGTQRYTFALRTKQWQYVILPSSIFNYPYLLFLLPANETNVEMNSIHWLAKKNSKGEKNSVTKFALKKVKNEKKLEVLLNAKPGEYCKAHQRIGLNFIPDKIELRHPKIKGGNPFNVTYNKASGILSIEGYAPTIESKNDNTVSYKLILSKTEEKTLGGIIQK